MAELTVAEMLTNLCFVKVSSFNNIKCQETGWPLHHPGEPAAIGEACYSLVRTLKNIDIAIDGGKDSLSMAATVDGKTIKSPRTLVLTSYVDVPDIYCRVTDLKPRIHISC